MNQKLQIRDVQDAERDALGRLMVEVYSALEGFPKPDEQPRYYELLRNVWKFAEKKDARVLVALTPGDELAGGVVYFGDMAEYGSGGTASGVKDASGIRLLAVDPEFRGSGAGRALTDFCIELARARGHAEVVLHTTAAMKVAWNMYGKLGFERSTDLDFMQENLQVYGFRLRLHQEAPATSG